VNFVDPSGLDDDPVDGGRLGEVTVEDDGWGNYVDYPGGGVNIFLPTRPLIGFGGGGARGSGREPQETPEQKGAREREWIKCWNKAIADQRAAWKEIDERYDARLRASVTSNLKQAAFWGVLAGGTTLYVTKNPWVAAQTAGTVLLADAGKGIIYEVLWGQLFAKRREETAVSYAYDEAVKKCDRENGPRPSGRH
jgi:hypothetical protein